MAKKKKSDIDEFGRSKTVERNIQKYGLGGRKTVKRKKSQK